MPGILQEAFPRYHGVVWYWRDVTPPVNPHAQGRYLLRFWNVDYLADVWVNGVHVGRHEGACEPFVLDVTDAVKPQAVNRIAVRVLNPTNQPIDGIKLSETAHTAKSAEAWVPGRGPNWGGITDSVELIVAPAVRVEDLFVRPDPKTGIIRVQANLRNAGKQRRFGGRIVLCVSPATSGETLNALQLDRELPPGDTLIETELKVENPRLWELNDPYLYRVTVRVSAASSPSFDEQSTRCGFRDFRLENGYFRLNGKRLFVKSSHTGCETPVGVPVALDPDLLRKDLLNCKVMGMNMIRSFTGLASRYQIELCDEIGLMMYQENYASWFMEQSPKMAERFDRATLAMVKRDRNHPSIVIWGLLNETPKGPVVDQAIAALPLVRKLDDTRMVLLNSGGYDGTSAFANPGDWKWQTDLADQHPYQPLPHNAGVINTLRTVNGGQKPYWLSEYGMGSAVDLARLTRHYEQLGNTTCEDAVIYRRFFDQFMADWNRWNLGDTFANPEDYFHQCVAWMAPLRKLGTSAIRANPHVIGHSVTGTQDQGLTGEGLTANIFRELKPGVVDAMFDAFAPLRWCLFVEPVQVYRGRKAKLEAVLANEDMLAPGDYPARLQVVGPRGVTVFDRTITVKIPDPKGKPEPAFAMPVFAEDVVIDGPSGKYRFLATFEKGAAAAGGDVEFYVADPADMPKVETEVVLWGDDPDLGKMVERQRNQDSGVHAGNAKLAGGDFGGQSSRRRRGRGVPRVGPAYRPRLQRRLPRARRSSRRATRRRSVGCRWRTRALGIRWTIGSTTRTIGRRIIRFSTACPPAASSNTRFIARCCRTRFGRGQDVPAEAVAGSINTAIGYSSGLTVAVYKLGAGRFTLNTLRIRENLGNDPVAERLLRNMLR